MHRYFDIKVLESLRRKRGKMRIEIFSSWDDMIGLLWSERLDFGLYQRADTTKLYWSDYRYSETVRKAFPGHQIHDHGEYFYTQTFRLSLAQIKRRINSACIQFQEISEATARNVT